MPGKNDAREAPGPADAYRLLYEDAQRSIASQEQKVDELRGRAGILLSAAAVVSAFLGAGPLTTDRAHPATVLGVLAFAGVVATTLAILVPWPFIKWEWRFGTKKILGDYIESEPSASMAEIYRSLAWHYAEMRGRNDRKIRALQWLFIAASGLIGLQTIAWLLAPSGGG